MPQILFVTEIRVWPPYGGEKIHASQMIASLSRLAEVTVLAPQPPDDCPLLAQVQNWHNLTDVPTSFRSRLLASPSVVMPRHAWWRMLDRLLDGLHPQIVWFNYGHWGHYAGLAHRYGARTVMQTHNVQSRLAWQGLASRPLTRWHLYYATHAPLETLHERLFFRFFDRVLSVNEADRCTHAGWINPARSLYLPNFIDEAWYHQEGIQSREDDLLVMTANYGAFQNQAGATWFVKHIWPRVRVARPTAHLLLVGSAPAAWRQRIEAAPGVTCTGSVATVTPYLRRATLAVVPLLHGSGTRFKILEALACETPLVSTPVAAEGIALVNGIHAGLTAAPDTFAAMVIELLADSQQRQTLAAHGLALLRAEYSAAVNTERLRCIVNDVMEANG